jgi:hypothetical protein
MPRLQAPFYMEEKVGKRLGECYVLQPKVQAGKRQLIKQV